MNDIPVVGMLDIWKDFLCMIIIIRNSELTARARVTLVKWPPNI